MGNLYIVATPIGNLEDITIRAIKTLFTVNYIACEDTRKTGQLLNHLAKCHPELTDTVTLNLFQGLKRIPKQVRNDIGIKYPQLISYYDEIEFKRIPEIIELLQSGKNVALVSNSGTPLISDPGFKLVQECIKRGIRITSIPGPTSLITALTSSGVPTNNFLFLGYLPSNKNKRIKLLTSLQHWYASRYTTVVMEIHPTIIFFETPHRLKESLEDLEDVFGNIDIVIARELTKIHEEVWRGKISEAINHFTNIKGEFILMFSINPDV